MDLSCLALSSVVPDVEKCRWTEKFQTNGPASKKAQQTQKTEQQVRMCPAIIPAVLSHSVKFLINNLSSLSLSAMYHFSLFIPAVCVICMYLSHIFLLCICLLMLIYVGAFFCFFLFYVTNETHTGLIS